MVTKIMKTLESKFIKGTNVEEVVAYRPKVHPGYAAWVNLFPGKDGDMYLSFLEIRKEKNSNFQPMPLEFYESLGLPVKIGSDLLGISTPDFVFEYPVLISDQNGRNWHETGRSVVFDRHFSLCMLPDGSLLRAHSVRFFRYDLGKERFRSVVSRSTDDGTTWEEYSTIVEGYCFFFLRFRVLRNGTLIAVGCISSQFGPETERFQRHMLPPGVVNLDIGVFFLSYDQGKTWSVPQTIVPGEECSEPDFVELPSGDLLFINSTSQASRNTRQYYYRIENGYIPGPVIEIKTDPHFIVPETVVITDDGLIVGARRWQGEPGSGTYACSNDEGDTWHVIGGLPRCLYQPMIQQFKGGRFICASHLGADTRYGEFDMYIAVHIFGLEGKLPVPTRLAFSREMNAQKTQYINAYSAILTVNDKPLAGRKIEFYMIEGVSRENHLDVRLPKDVWTRGEKIEAITNAEGKAIVSLAEYDRIIDIHIDYMIGARFQPDPDEELLPCHSEVYLAYAMTPKRNSLNNYDIYLIGGVLWVSAEVLNAYPEIKYMVEEFSAKGIEALTKQEVIKRLQVSDERAQEVIGVLLRWNVLLSEENEEYHWNPVRKWASINNPVLIREVRKICVFDYLI